MSLLDPVSHALAALIAATHLGLTHLGADPAAGTTWLLCIAVVVVTVRLALLPLVVHGVRVAHASARARPQLQDLARRHRNRQDLDSARRLVEERRRIAAEHGMPRLGFLPMMLQIPIWWALYHLVTDVAAGVPAGAMGTELVASLGAATLLGVPLAQRGYLGLGATHLAGVAGLAVAAAGLAYVTQRYLVANNTVTEGLPEALATAQQWLPALSAVGLIAAGGFVPVALLAYWVCNSVWTLAQSAVIYRWFPTPGSPAALRAGTGAGGPRDPHR
ncbi:MAG TPA: membrane protein insertase YidC [Nocardioides sp.]|jgi:YidC/Oxa1 family membrane protein insertase|nr:membrane protein insertase YidC [Nocardioides sp.]